MTEHFTPHHSILYASILYSCGRWISYEISRICLLWRYITRRLSSFIYANRKNSSLNQSSILRDFEQATNNAINDVLPQVSVIFIMQKNYKWGFSSIIKTRRHRGDIISFAINTTEWNQSFDGKKLSDVTSKFDKWTDYIINNCAYWWWSISLMYMESFRYDWSYDVFNQCPRKLKKRSLRGHGHS